MTDFFARLYEWFGVFSLYSHDLGEFLRGLDFGCTGYLALRWYMLVGIFMVIVSSLLFGLQYDLISGTRFKKQAHWELAALMVFAVNFGFAFVVTYTAVLTGNYCLRLKISLLDCLGFGVSNGVWGVIYFSLLSLVQKGLNAGQGNG